MLDTKTNYLPFQYKDIFEEPTNFENAWNHDDMFQREQWRTAINKEFKTMYEHEVWNIVERRDIPAGRKTIKCRWIFEIKRSGVFRARLVACGYSQVAGVDFTESFSPVMNDVTMRLMITAKIVNHYTSRIVDIERAFLHGVLEEHEKVYMNCPEGLDHNDGQAVVLIKTIYGLVQASRAYFLLMVKTLKGFGFEQSLADPCLFTRIDNDGTVHCGVYVDDIYIVRDDKAVHQAIVDIKSRFNITIEESLADYLSCEIKFDKNKTKAWIGQPHLMKKLRNKFETMVSDLQVYKTPGTPGQGVVRPNEGDHLVTSEMQTDYRSAVGMLLYLVKHSRPDISNAVRELSKCMDRADYDAFKELRRVIKYVLDTPDYGLKIEPIVDNKDMNIEWNLIVYSDSDWAGDKENRMSITGYIIFVHGVPITWKSRQQKSLEMSSSEAEYYALTEAAKEVKFVVQILITMGVNVVLPVIVRVDNIGAIWMAETLLQEVVQSMLNSSTTSFDNTLKKDLSR